MKRPYPGSTPLAALTPLAVTGLGLFGWLFLAGGVRGVVELLQRGGFFGWITALLVMLVAAGVSASGALVASGHRLPSALFVGLALLPWGVGLVGTFVGQGMIDRALAAVNPADIGTLFLAGTGEAMSTRALGAFGTGLASLSVTGSLLAGDRTRWPSALLSAALAVTAFSSAIAALGLAEGLGSVGFAAPEHRAVLLAEGLSQAMLFGWARIVGLGLVLITAFFGAAFGQRRAGVIVAALLGVTVLAGDEGVLRKSRSGAERIAALSNVEVPDFEPVPLANDRGGPAVLVVLATGAVGSGSDGSPISAAEVDQLIGRQGRLESLAIAPDRRAPANALLTLFDRAADQGVEAVALLGRGKAPPQELTVALGSDAPFLELATRSTGSVKVLTRAAATETSHREDPDLFHAELGRGETTLSVRTRPNAPSRPFDVRLDAPSPDRRPGTEHRLIRLTLRPEATAEDLVRAAVAITGQGDDLMVISGPMPGAPDAPLEPPKSALGLAGSGILGRLGAGGVSGFGTGSGFASKPLQRGRLPKEQIRRVITRRRAAFRYCYEKRLQKAPTLEGKVVVSFTIQRNGSVAGARIASSTMKDAEVEACLLKATSRLRFPKPKGGTVVVSYPFLFRPG